MGRNGINVSAGRVLAWIGLGVVFILSLGAFLTLKTLTLVRWWIPAVTAFVVAGMAGTTLWRIWRRLTGSPAFLPNFLLNLIFFTPFLTALFYSLNAGFVSDATPCKEQVRVEEKYRERHHTSRRTGRRSYISGPDYYEYYVGVTIREERRNIQLPYSIYKNIRQDSLLTLSLRRGLFGLDVIDTSAIPADNPALKNSGKKHRCHFFGTSGKR